MYKFGVSVSVSLPFDDLRPSGYNVFFSCLVFHYTINKNQYISSWSSLVVSLRRFVTDYVVWLRSEFGYDPSSSLIRCRLYS